MNRAFPVSSEPADLVYTVTELTRRIKRLLESRWSALWVEGELSNVSRSSAGHVYFKLKDDHAVLAGVLFRTDARRLRFEPENGQKVRAFGQITLYEPRGEYQIKTVKLEPVGLGELELAFRQLSERLRAEGLFAEERKRPLPSHPRTVGIVTSGSGAALRDLLAVTARRAPHVGIVLRPARVQGEGAGREVARALRELDAWGGTDVIVLGRGGGSAEDLQAFNEEVVARAIHACRTPVVSAVGHEVDVTIADFAADLRAATPSVAAELVVPDREAERKRVGRLSRDLAAAVTERLRERRERVNLLARARAFRRPLEFYRMRSQDVDGLSERLGRSIERLLERHRLVLRAAGGRLGALSPLAILERGYSIARDSDGRVLRRAVEAGTGDAVTVHLSEGELGCRVEEVRESIAPPTRSETR